MNTIVLLLLSVGISLIFSFLLSLTIPRHPYNSAGTSEHYEKADTIYLRNFLFVILFGALIFYGFHIQTWMAPWTYVWLAFLLWMILSAYLLARAAAAAGAESTVLGLFRKDLSMYSLRDSLRAHRRLQGYWGTEAEEWASYRLLVVYIPAFVFVVLSAAIQIRDRAGLSVDDLMWLGERRWSLVVLLATAVFLGLGRFIYRKVKPY